MASSRSVCDFLREHRAGVTHDELSDALQELVAAVAQEDRAGSLTFTINIKPYGKGDGLEVRCETKVKPPKQTPGASIFFATPENNLVRNDPRQQTLELRSVPIAREVREVMP